MTAWDRYDHLRRHGQAYACVLCAVTLVVGIASVWLPALRTAMPTLGMASIMMFQVSMFGRQMANMQASLDMKRFALDALKQPALAVVGETLRIDGRPVELRAKDGTRFIIHLKRIADGGLADIKVEYLG